MVVLMPIGNTSLLKDSGVFTVPRYIKKPAFECQVIADRQTKYNRDEYPGTIRGLDHVLVMPWNEHYKVEHVEFLASKLKEAVETLRTRV